MKHFILLFLAFANAVTAQEIINGSFDFQTENDKSYHIYIPSSYDDNSPNALMLALHPFNTNRWDGAAWRDTLINFAEENNLVLLSPDGGADGKIDDPIDTAFTSLVLDSMNVWYNIDIDNRYIMGFSWGGKTTYTYGLNHADKFKGFLPIGAAINISEVSDIIMNANGKPFFLVHGANDKPDERFSPFLDGLGNELACVESTLMNNVGHTIDFPNRNLILTEAFQYLKNSDCNVISDIETNNNFELQIIPNPNKGSFSLGHDDNINITDIRIFDRSGMALNFIKSGNQIEISNANSGIYFLKYRLNDTTIIKKVIIN